MATRIQYSEAIERIQTHLESCLGDRLRVRANLGRSKIVEAVGVLEQAHPKLFIMKVEDGDQLRRLSYSYADLLTHTVELTEPETEQNLLPWLHT